MYMSDVKYVKYFIFWRGLKIVFVILFMYLICLYVFFLGLKDYKIKKNIILYLNIVFLLMFFIFFKIIDYGSWKGYLGF